MGIRESIQSNSKIVVIAAMLIGGGALLYSLRTNMSGPQLVPALMFATVDDGQTVFETDMSNLPPFQKDGKTAYRVALFTTDGGKTRFPGYLERYTPDAKKRIEAAIVQMAKDPDPRKRPRGLGGPGDVEVKKPGAGNPWVRNDSPEGMAVMNVKAPNGGEIDIVLP